MEEINQIIKILTAFSKGEQLQYYTGKCWRDFEGNISYLLNTITGLDWRIKPESVYRPYANAEEFLKASKEHGPFLFIEKTDYTPKKYIQPSEIQDDFVEIGTAKIGYDNLLKHLTWGDNTKCGILEAN